MKRFLLIALLRLAIPVLGAEPTTPPGAFLKTSATLPSLPPRGAHPSADWLLGGFGETAGVYRGQNEHELVLNNGLIQRVFRLDPNGATVALHNLMTGAEVLRAVKPEATVTIDEVPYDVGGLSGQPEKAYLLSNWLDQMHYAPGSFRCVGFAQGPTVAPFPWKRKRHAADLPWPVPGVALQLRFEAPAGVLQGLELTVHYELYDGLPVLAKWLTISNRGVQPVVLNSFTSEVLATAEAESAVDERPFRNWRLPALELLSDYSFHGMDATTASQTTAWLTDPQYTSQVNYELKMPAMVVSRAPLGPEATLDSGGQFESFRTFVVVYDSDERERQGLILRRVQRALAPWVSENPIMMHVRSAETKVFRNAVDQCAETGFEMIIYTFGSGLDMESEDAGYFAKVRADVEYAHAKGIEVGAYSLLASRHVSAEDDVINPKTGKIGGAIFGQSPCLGSAWADQYFRKLKNFIEVTGLDLLEHDGSYPGDVCASTHHPGHRGVDDSQWNQWRRITEFYHWCRGRGVYLNVPDYYFLAGSSKTGMGYRESNWSLPRERQIILGRQNIYDGTWTKAPSMGWMFVPLVEYQGGGLAATLEPLHSHLDAYAAHLMNNFGAGVQACYRGPRLYDTEETRAMVTTTVSWFKAYRQILESDLIHIRRPDGQDLDCFLHVNPALKQKAMAVIYNPLHQEVERTLVLPLRYAAINDTVSVREQEGVQNLMHVDREHCLRLPVKIAPNAVTWFVLESAETTP